MKFKKMISYALIKQPYFKFFGFSMLLFILFSIKNIDSINLEKKKLSFYDAHFYPNIDAENINPDVQLRITFKDPPIIGDSGFIKIYNYTTNKIVDSFDMSIPPGPKNTRTLPEYKDIEYRVEEEYNKENLNQKGKVFVQEPLNDIYQKKYIGGNLESDVYHFYPILINKNVVTICPRNNALKYGEKYYIQIDEGILNFKGSSPFALKDKSWSFSTKK